MQAELPGNQKNKQFQEQPAGDQNRQNLPDCVSWYNLLLFICFLTTFKNPGSDSKGMYKSFLMIIFSNMGIHGVIKIEETMALGESLRKDYI